MISRINIFHIQAAIVAVLAFFLGLGKIAYADSGIGIIHILVALFVILSFFLDKRLIKELITPKMLLLWLLVLSLGLSELLSANLDMLAVPVIDIKLIISILFFVSLKRFVNKKAQNINIIMIAFAIGVIFLLVLFFFAPGVAVVHKGKFLIYNENPNSSGTRFAIASIAIFYFLFNFWFTKSVRIILLSVFLLLVYFTIMSGSRGSLIIVFLSALVIVNFSTIKKRYKFLVVLFVLGTVLIGANELTKVEGDIGKKWSLAATGDMAGRSNIWDAALNDFYDNPVLGVGKSGLWNTMERDFGTARDAHNLFVFLLTTGGLSSFLLFTYFFLLIFVNAFRYRRHDYGLRLTLWISALLLAMKTGGALIYLVLWFLYALAGSRPNSLNKRKVSNL